MLDDYGAKLHSMNIPSELDIFRIRPKVLDSGIRVAWVLYPNGKTLYSLIKGRRSPRCTAPYKQTDGCSQLATSVVSDIHTVLAA